MKAISVPVLVRMFVTWLVTATPLVTWTPRAIGADLESTPVAIVTVSSYDDVLKTMDSFGRLANRPQLRQIAEGALAAYSGGRGLAGIDVHKPWGLTIHIHSKSSEAAVFAPVEDFPALLESLQLLSTGGAPEIEPGVHQLESPQGKVFVTLRDNFAVFVQTTEQLNRVPDRPGDLLDDLSDEYDLAARIDVQAIPRNFRSMLLQQLRQGAKLGMRRLPSESDAQFEARRRMTKMQLAQLTASIDEMKQITMGWKMDRQADSMLLDLSATGLEGSKLAEQSASCKDLRSRFNGFLPADATLTFGLTSPIAASDVEQGFQTLKVVWQQMLVDNQAAGASFDDIWSVIEDTFKQGKVDVAGFLQADADQPSPPTSFNGQGAMAFAIADADRLQASIRRLTKDSKVGPVVEWNALRIKGISFHRVTPKKGQPGNQLVIGFAQHADGDAVYVAIDSHGDVASLVKEAIEKSEQAATQKVLPFRMSITPSDLLASREAHKKMPEAAKVWQTTGGQDHVHLSRAAIPGGCRYRLQLDRAFLQAFATLMNRMQ